MTHDKTRCSWADLDNEQYVEYHDTEWGVPQYDDFKLFEHIVLETAQAGLSWLTILRKREDYKKAFANFDPHAVANFTTDTIEDIFLNSKIVKNNKKITSTVSNAQAFVSIQNEFGSFANYQWGFVKNIPIQNCWRNTTDVPAQTDLSFAFSQDLKKRGFKFVGPVNMYAHMQATGLVNDHTTNCFRHKEVTHLNLP